MAGENPFIASPLDNAISEAEARRKAAEAAAAGIGLPEAPARSATRTPRQFNGTDIPYRQTFEDTAKKYGVPVNVLLALAEQESTFNPDAFNPETSATGLMQYIPATAQALKIDPRDPVQSIDAAARQYAERIAKGMSHADAIKEHFAGPNRNLWGPKTDQYGKEVLERAKRFAKLYSTGQAPAAQNDNALPPGKLPGDVDPKFVGGTPENIAAQKGGDTLGFIDWALKNTDEATAPARSYLAQSWKSGGHNLASAMSLLANEAMGIIGGGAPSDEELAKLYKNDPEGLRRQRDESEATTLTRFAREQNAAAEKAMKDISPEAKAAYGDLKYATTDAGKSALLSPVKMFGDAVQSLPTTIALGLTALLTRGASAKAEQAALASGASAEAAKQAGIEAAKNVASKFGAASEGSVGYAQQSVSTQAQVEGMPQDEIEKSPLYQDLIGKGYDQYTARVYVASKTGNESGINAGVVDAAMNMVGGKFLGEVIGEGGKLLPRTAKGAAVEGATETAQSAGEKVAENSAIASNVNQDQGLLEGTGEAAVQGLAVGGLTGGAMSAAFGSREAQNPAAGGISPDQPGAAPAPAAQPQPAAQKPSGPLSRSVGKAAAPAAPAPTDGDAVDQSDLGDVLDRVIASGQAGTVDADGNPVTGAPPAAAAAAVPAPTPAAAAAQGLDAGTENIDFRAERQRALDEKAKDADQKTASFGEGDSATKITATRNSDGTYRVRGDYLIATQGREKHSPGGLETSSIPAASADEAIEAFKASRVAELQKQAAENARKAEKAREKRPELVADFERAAALAQAQLDAMTGKTSAAEQRKPIAGRQVKKDTVVTPAGREVGVEYRVVEASDLVTSNDDAGNVNPAYPQALQPRDRTRAASELHVSDIANNLNPRLLAESPTTSDGAPMVSPDGVVESGNGRTIAIKRAYSRHPEAAERYRKHLQDMGVDTTGMQAPVLVRVRTSDMSEQELADYTRESNERTTLSMSATERAQADAKAVPPIIEDYKGGDVTDAANRTFVRKFIQGAVSKTDQAQMAGPDGQLTQDGRRRIEAAIMSAAYGDGALVADLFESADSDIKTIGGALMDVAPRWAKLRASADALAEGVDITPNLIEAVNIVRRARAEGKTVNDLVNNGDMFKGDVDQTTRDILRMFFRGDAMARGRSRKDIVEGLGFYADQALETKAGAGLFGEELPTVTNRDLLGNANERLAQGERQQANQQDFFGARTRFDDEGAGAPGGQDRGPQPEARSEPAAEAKPAEGLTEKQAGEIKRKALADAKGVLDDELVADLEEQAQDRADNMRDFLLVSAELINKAIADKKASGTSAPAAKAKPQPATTADGQKIYSKGVASMQAAQRTKKTGQTHEALQVDGGWVVRPVGEQAAPAATERRAAPAAGEPRERRVPGRTPPVTARDVWHDKLADDVRKDEASSATYAGLPVDVRRKINEERLAARMKGEPLPIDPTSGLINGKAMVDEKRAENGTAKGTMLEGMLDSAINHVKAGGQALVSELDLGNLGGINHFSGQVGGDRAIADVSAIIRKEIDAAGLGDAVDLARYGGDEFYSVARSGDSAAIGRALAAADKAVQDYMGKTTPRDLNPGLEAEINGAAGLKAEDKADLLRFIDTPLSKLPKKPVVKADGTREYPAGKTKIHVGRLVEVSADMTAEKLHATADSYLAAAKNANYTEKGNEQQADELAGVRGAAEQGAQGAAVEEAWAGGGAPRADRAAVQAVDGGEGAGGEVAARVAQGAGGEVTGRFANNKLFTADKVAAARERIKNKLNGSQLNAGFDPELLTDGMTIAGAYIEAGVRDFSAFAKQMAGDFGDTIKPYLLSFWEGARNYPGLETDGMTDLAESARLHKDLMAEPVQAPAAAAREEAIGTIVEKPKSTRKASGTAGDKRLRQDWGVDNIDGYAESDEFEGAGQTDWGIKGGVKDAFLKDAKGYMTAVAGLLEAAGFEATRGKAVSSNPSGPAVSGDVSLSMKRGDVRIYATVGASSLRGVVPGTGAGVAVMFRAGKGSDTNGMNRWVSPDLPARDLAALITQEADRAAAAPEKRNEPRKLEGAGKGALEGAPAEGVPAAAAQGPAGAGAARGGRADAQGNERAGSAGVQRAGGVGAGAGAAPVQAAGGRDAGARPAGSARDARGAADGERDAGSHVGAGDRVASLPAQDRAADFTITDGDGIGEGGAKTKFNNNLAAIRLLKELQSQGRAATREEQAILAKYVGWGGLPQAFYREGGGVTSGWEKQAAELKEALTAEEYAAAAASTKDAHYTSPEIVAGIWSAVEQFGFRAGRVLEPSVGVGNFFGLMPKDARAASQLVGVELDAITGGIAKLLYPAANVQSPVGFQDFATPSNYFDLAIGNPPFGATKIYDGKRRDLSGLSIHNYFFAKSVDALKPGGVLAMVVTNRFMDAYDQKARKLITDKTDLLGAIRLPNNAFLKNAGTEVTTDIIFLRKRADGDTASSESWMEVKDYTDKDGNTVPLNEYFHRNPEMMLGEFGAYGTMYRAGDSALVAREGQDTGKLLAEAVSRLPRDIMESGPAAPVAEVIAPASDISAVKVGSMYVDGGKVMVRLEDELGSQRGKDAEFPNEKARERAIGMIGVRDALTDLRRLQLSNTAKDAQIEAARTALNKAYDRFVNEFGPINVDANKRVFRDDPSWPQLSALEDDFDKGVSAAIAAKTGEKPRKPSAKKAAIFSKRTQTPYQPPTSAKTAKDAMVASLAEVGRIDMAYMSELYGKTEEQMAKELAGLIYRNPVGSWETKDQYLSGNVKQKLAIAEAAAKEDQSYHENVEALREVQPADIEPVDIDVKPGAHWLPPADMGAFADHIAGRQGSTASYSPLTASWSISASPTAEASAMYGTDRVSVSEIIRAAANQKRLQVFDTMPDDTRVLNEGATQAANEKVEKVKAEFRRWIWADEERRVRLARLYNDTFNTDRQREYDGSHLTFPGKIGDDIIRFRPHQSNAVWRIIQSPTTLTDHVVGAGKTFTLIGAAMEMRRMKLANKPMFVVPNHLVGQWAADFVKLYPGANILAASKKDFENENRKRLFSRIATGDWDAVIVAHSSFGKVGVTPEFESKFIQMQIDDIEASMTSLRETEGKKSRNVKQLEKARASLEEKMKALLDQSGKDDAIYFDELGVDALFVDEEHEFKNLSFSTSMQRVAGLGNPAGSQKAADLFMKVMQVQSRTGGRNIVFATGTPISNTMAEMYTMQRYLDYPTLKAQGLAHFDAWARMFGEVVTDWELSPSGQYKMNSRFAKFVNMPELMQRYGSFADVVNRDDINRMLASQGKTLPVPKVKGGKPHNVVVERSNDQALYIGVPNIDDNGNEEYPQSSLIWRSENLPKKAEKGSDNMLKIMSDARKAALDMRLIDPSYPDNPSSKVNNAADRIVDIYKKWDADKGTQLVFIDLSTPKAARGAEAARIRELIAKAEQGDQDAQDALDKMNPDDLLALESDFSVYDDLREKLIQRGIPAEEVAFIHEATTEDKKEVMFGKVRAGRIRVLFGSTAKMGAGMNVQERLVALHHLDAPWRPSDLEQREGRIIRQGNVLRDRDPEGFEVEILRYATKQTLDSRMWQTIEAKARFIEQVRKGMAGSREIEDIGGEAANSAEMKAASSGNPLILEEMELRQKVRKLGNEASEHDREQFRIQDMIRARRGAIERGERRMEQLAKDAARVPAEFVVTVGKTSYDKPKDLGAAIILKAAELNKTPGKDSLEIGSYGDFTLSLDKLYNDKFVLVAAANGEYQVEIKGLDADPTGLAIRLKNTITQIPDMRLQQEADIERAREEIPKLEAQLKPWDKADDLAAAKARHQTVIDQLKPKKKDEPKKPDEDAGKASVNRYSSGMTVEAVTKSITDAGLGSLLKTGKVVVHADTSEFPGKWKSIEGVQAVTMPDGTIHFAASGVEPQDVVPALLHEAFHSDVERLIGTPAWNKLQDELRGLYNHGRRAFGGKMGEFWSKAAGRVSDAESVGIKMSEADRIEEFGAYAIEEYESAPPVVKGWVDRFTGLVKAWLLKRFGLQAGEVTPAQLRELAKMALRDASYASRREAMASISAWHGSPHSFDKFSLEHMGKGEGAQAYGWGLYFAGKMEVGEYYRSTLAKYPVEDVLAREIPERKYFDPAEIGEFYTAARDASVTGKMLWNRNRTLRDISAERLQNAVDAIRADGVGQLYRVEIPDEDNYLLWDKPLSEQTKTVRKALDALMAEYRTTDPQDAEFLQKAFEADGTGAAIYKRLTTTDSFTGGEDGQKKAASMLLNKHGIAGIKYLDGTSRGAREGTFNYVIFDDNAISIVEKASVRRRDITDTPAFKRWFGDSKVVDADGKPLVVYHGTGRSFSKFKSSKRGNFGSGIYLASGPDQADAFAYGDGDTGANIMPLYVSIKRPLYTSADYNVGDDADVDSPAVPLIREVFGNEANKVIARLRNSESGHLGEAVRKRLEEAGHDGIIATYSDGSKEYIAFRPEQIKSAYNSGNFDPTNPDIRASVRRPRLPRLPMQEQPRNRFDVPAETGGQKLQRIFQDRFNRVAIVQRVVAEQGGTVSEASNVYQAEERYHGRVTARIEDFAENEIQPFIKAVADAGVTLDEVAEFAYAEHAPERNAYIASINDRFSDGNGSGMTDEQAADVIARYEAEGKAGKLAELTKQMRDIAAGTRSLIVKEGLEPADRVDAWEAMFDKYVPLRGFEQADEFGNEVPSQGTGLGGKGFSVRGKESKAATGRASRASQIIENIVAQRERTLMRAEKNRVAKALLRLVAENPDKALWEINEVKQKPAVTAGGKAAITDIFTDTPANAPVVEGKKVVYRPVRNQYGDEVVVAKVNGREVLISIKDPILAEQLQMRDAKDLPPLFAELNTVNRAIARLWTSLNPVFSVVNYARDIQTAAINALGETNAKVAAKTVAYAAPGGWAMRATIDAMRGKDSEGALWYERYRQAGGKTGFMTFATLEDRTKQLENMLREARGDRAKMVSAGAKVVEFVEGLNALVENAVRLGAFRAGIENGMTTAEAASFAKNLTVNFNRRGEWTHFFGALYLFFNPAVQGTARLTQALRRPKVQFAAAGLVIAATGLAFLARVMGGNDDDDEPYFDKIPASIKDRNLIVMITGTKGDYIKVPMPYGYSFFASLGNAIYDAGATDTSKVKIAGNLASAFAMSFNPVGDGMPTIFTPLAQIAMNEDRFGRQIMPEPSKFETPTPDSQRYFPSMEGTLLQRTMAAVNEATGGNDVRPGLIDVSPESVEHVYQFVTGGLGTAIKDTVKYLTQDEQEATTLPFVKQVVGSKLRTAPVNKFYENATEAELAAAEREMFESRGDEAALAEFDREQGWKVDMEKRAQKLRKQLAKLRRESKAAAADDSLSSDEKLRIKKEVADEMNALAAEFNKEWNAAKKEARGE